MRIIVWGINYAPELTGIAPYNTAMCEFLAAKGHDVEMVTAFPYYPEWRRRDEDRGKVYRTVRQGEVTLHRCWLFVPGRVTTIKRMLHEASFVTMSLLRILTLPKPDVYMVVSPPLLLGVAAWIAGLVKQAPFTFHVQDLQPDAAVGLGMLRKGLLVRVLYWMEAFAYRHASSVSGISDGMLEMFRKKGVPEKKIVYFPNWVQVPEAQPARGAFRQRHGLADDLFVAVYSGNLGVKQGLEILVDAMALLRDAGDSALARIRVVIAGEGARRADLEAAIRAKSLDSILLLPLQAEPDYRQMLADADCCIITQQSGTGQFFFPSKLLASLAMGKPVLSVADEDSELAKACRAGEFGVNTLPGDPAGLAAALKRMAGETRALA